MLGIILPLTIPSKESWAKGQHWPTKIYQFKTQIKRVPSGMGYPEKT
jgi:hypothetical protein